jgi:hypothetical protein
MNYVFASFFNGKKCPQRNVQWSSDPKLLLPLIESVVDKSDATVVIFYDNLEYIPKIERCIFKKVNISNLYAVTVERWFHYLNEINCNNDITNLFMVDSTDVKMLNNPFINLAKDQIYCGSEYRWLVGDRWLKKRRKKFHIEDYLQVLEKNSNNTMLNAGIVGSDIKTATKFLEILTRLHRTHSQKIIKSLDMPIFNYTILKYFQKNYITGNQVHTPYKDNIKSGESWWKHK